MSAHLVSLVDALQQVRAASAVLSVEVIPVSQALGRILAEPILACADLPAFDNTAMDGFALATRGKAVTAGAEFAVTGLSAAGDARGSADSGAWRIMTGAPMPSGCDAVVPVEQVEVLACDASGAPSRIRTTAEVMPGQHVRRAGEDVQSGQALLAAGDRVGAEAVMALAAQGIGSVAVRRRPRVAVLCTGRELVDDPSRRLADGQIRNSNGPFLAAALPGYGAEVVLSATIPDSEDAFLTQLAEAEALACDVVISTGAVSMGDFDFVPAVLARSGAEVFFHKIRMRPGKPLLFARLASGALFFGLPGNPVSAAVGLRFFVSAALRTMLGRTIESPLSLPLSAAFRKKPGLALLAKARVAISEGAVSVALLAGQESFRIAPLLAANAWAVVPENAANCAVGECVDVFPLAPAGFEL